MEGLGILASSNGSDIGGGTSAAQDSPAAIEIIKSATAVLKLIRHILAGNLPADAAHPKTFAYCYEFAVLRTESAMVFISSGLIVRISITSASMPCSASFFAACNAHIAILL